MFEVKITISAPELAQAINNLAAALMGAKPQQAAPAIQQTAPAPVPQPQAAQMQQPVPAPQGYAPANPTPAATSAVTAQTNAPVAPQAGPTFAPPSNPPTGVPVTAPPQYTIDQIMKAGATLMDAGRVDDLMNLLHSFGVMAVTDLKPEQLGAFATALRQLGAKI